MLSEQEYRFGLQLITLGSRQSLSSLPYACHIKNKNGYGLIREYLFFLLGLVGLNDFSSRLNGLTIFILRRKAGVPASQGDS
jgi:hypothetical protein